MSKLKNTRLEVKIIASLGAVIFCIIFIYTAIFSRHYEKYEDAVIGQENLSTLHSLDASVSTVMENADNYSKMLVADSIIQQQMETGNLFYNVSEQQDLINRIYAVLQFADTVEAVWLIDQRGQKLTVGGSASISYENEENESERYRFLKQPYGRSQMIVNFAGEKPRLTLVRSYNSLESFSSLGIIGVEIDSDILDELVSGIINLETDQIVILNETDQILYQGGDMIGEDSVFKAAEALSDEQMEVLDSITVQNIQYLVSGVLSSESRWKILRFTPIQRKRSISEIVRFNFVLILLIGIMILCGAALLSRMLTKPIRSLLVCMKETENGRLMRVVENPGLEEFKVLFKGYNHMVDRIELLIRETIERQRRIRQVELNEIQEQMKPHFLYNTLDSIEALAMMGDTENVCRLVEALGDFYRKSVSGGREFLSLGEECKMAEDYIQIMKIRFGESFACEICLEENCSNYLLPKLTIQPLLENAFQHGIRTRKQFGNAGVRCRKEEEKIHILVWDDGAGVPEDVIRELAEEREPGNGKSLGLRGTIERLRLLYGEAFSYNIERGEKSVIHLYIETEALEERVDG